MEESKNKSNYFAAIAVLIILCFGLLVHKLLKAQERITLLESNNNDLINKVVVGQLKLESVESRGAEAEIQFKQSLKTFELENTKLKESLMSAQILLI